MNDLLHLVVIGYGATATLLAVHMVRRERRSSIPKADVLAVVDGVDGPEVDAPACEHPGCIAARIKLRQLADEN